MHEGISNEEGDLTRSVTGGKNGAASRFGVS